VCAAPDAFDFAKYYRLYGLVVNMSRKAALLRMAQVKMVMAVANARYHHVLQ